MTIDSSRIVWGVFGGMLWCTGAVANFVASQAHIVGPAVSCSIGQGAAMVSVAWGVFVWHEFTSAHREQDFPSLDVYLFCCWIERDRSCATVFIRNPHRFYVPGEYR